MCALGICSKFVGSHQDIKQQELIEEPEDDDLIHDPQTSEREQLSGAKLDNLLYVSENIA